MSKKKSHMILMVLILIIGTISPFIPKKLNATLYGSICGKVIAGDTGMPLKNAQIFLYVHRPDVRLLSPRTVLTDKEGNFCFKMLKEEKYYISYTAPHPYIGNYGLFFEEYLIKDNFKNWPGTIILDKGENVNVAITVDQIGGSISGRVLKGDGITPFPEVQISVYSSEGSSAFDSSKEDGSYRCTHLIPADNYELWSRVPGYGIKRITGIRVEAYKETSGINIIINTDDPTGVEGIVTAPDGKPLILATVTVKNEWGVGYDDTFKDGRYSISGLEPGIYTLMITASLNFNEKPQTKEIEGVIIEKGKKTKMDVVFDSSLKEQSGCFKTFSNQSVFFK